MLGEISGWLAEAGHDVEMITAQPSYKPNANIPAQPWREVRRGVSVRRLWLLPENGMGPAKVINAALFVVKAFFIVLFGRKRDVVWTGTMPPVVQAALLSRAAKLRGAKFLYHMQDIHPEITSVADRELRLGIIGKFMRWLDVRSLNRTDHAVVISPDMADVLQRRGATPKEVHVLRNFALGDEALDQTVPLRPAPDARALRFVFAGNIGRFQNLEALVDAFARLDPNDTELVIVGDGRAKPALQARVKANGIRNVTFRDHMSETEVFEFLLQQDVGLISLAPGLSNYAFPSKLWTYLAAGLPVFSMVEAESDLANFLTHHNVGSSLPWDRPTQELSAALRATSDRIRSADFRQAPRTLYHRSSARVHWQNLFRTIEQQTAEKGRNP